LLSKYYPVKNFSHTKQELEAMLEIDRKSILQYFGQKKMIEVDTALIIIELVNPTK